MARVPRAVPGKLDPQPCVVCKRVYAAFGFGLPPMRTLWACRACRGVVGASAARMGLVVAGQAESTDTLERAAQTEGTVEGERSHTA